MAYKFFSHITNLFIFHLQLIYFQHSTATQLTYNGCMSDSVYSYQVGGWCFLYYYNSSWATNTPTQDEAQSMCLPHGNLAVGVTYKMLHTINTNIQTTSGQLSTEAWMGLVRDPSQPNVKIGWQWSTLLPDGNRAIIPVISSSIPWGPTQPQTNKPQQNSAVMEVNYGMANVQNNITYNVYSRNMRLAIICQFAPQLWSYTLQGHGLFTNPAYLIAQSSTGKFQCLSMCHNSVFCVALAFNSATGDCQIYAVSPEDPRFSNQTTVNTQYDWHVRDGMEY